MKVYNVVIVFSGIISDILTFDSMDKAKNEFLCLTGYEYGTDLRETKYNESGIYETEIQ